MGNTHIPGHSIFRKEGHLRDRKAGGEMKVMGGEWLID